MFGLGLPELFLILLVIPGTLFWLWMLVDAATQEQEASDKIVWVLIVLFTHLLGAAVYFFVRRRPRARVHA